MYYFISRKKPTIKNHDRCTYSPKSFNISYKFDFIFLHFFSNFILVLGQWNVQKWCTYICTALWWLKAGMRKIRKLTACIIWSNLRINTHACGRAPPLVPPPMCLNTCRWKASISLFVRLGWRNTDNTSFPGKKNWALTKWDRDESSCFNSFIHFFNLFFTESKRALLNDDYPRNLH